MSSSAPLRMYGLEGPVWLPANAPARALYPPLGLERRAKVLFLGASATNAASEPARMDVAGWLSRAVPLFLSESAFVLLGLDTVTLLPWNAERGFAVFPQPWSDEDMRRYAVHAGAQLCVAGHVTARDEAAHVTLKVLSAEAAFDTIISWSREIAWERPDGALPGLWARLAGHLAAALGDAPAPPDPQRYRLPGGAGFLLYLHSLEQVAGIRCQGSEAPGTGALPSQYAAVRSTLKLARTQASSLPARLLLHEAMLRMRDLDRSYVEGLRTEVEALQTVAAFPDANCHAVLARQLEAIYPR